METFLLNLLKTSLLDSLAILAMLVLKPLWRERYRAKTRCWLWLALAAFLLLPVDFSVKNAPVQAAPPKDYTLFVGTDKTAIQSTDNLFGDMAEKSGQSPAQVRDTIIQRPVTNPEQKTTRYIPVTTILFYGYLAGAAAFLLYQGISYALFRRTVRRWKRDVSRADYAAMLSDTARDLGVSAPEMIVCEAISTPAVTGLLRPRLLLPHERYDVQELRYILRHELCHLKRRDMLLKLVLLAANAMHWFNPVVYLMLRQADEDIELACDSAATDGLELPERAAYSRTLLAAVQSSVRALPATTCFGGTVERLKRRITNVLGAQKKRGLGIVALVLALTLTAGCAVSWGNKNELSDPFGKSYTIADIVYIGVEPDDTFRENAANAELLLRSDAQSMTLTWTDHYKWDCTAAGSFEMTEENFDRYFDGSAFEAADNPAGWQESDMSAAKLRRENANTWCFTTSSPPDGLTDYLCLLQQKDGTLYLAMGYYPDSKQTAPHCFHTLFRLAEKAVPIYASMDDYAAACVEDLKQGTMTYYTSENGNYGSQAVEDTVADVRVTQLEFADSLGNLSPDGTVLELWYFQYEMKPTNEAGVEIEPVGGQYVTDDGYLRESWTHYLTVLRYTYGEKTGYQVIGTYTGNDGLWYDGCNYSGEEKYYLHDFYIDYAGLSEPKMYIPNLLNAATDGYGRANQCEAQLVAGKGYYYYVPITAWARSSDAEFWYSRYDTGSYFSVKKLSQSLAAAKAEWESTGAKAEKTDTGWRFVTNEGMSSTVITLFDAPDNTCYEVEIHWSFDGSTAENEWGWNRDRAVEGEAEVLRAMVKRFTVTAAVRPTQEDADSALDAALKQLGDMSSEVTLSLSVNGTDSSIYDGSTVINRAYFARQLSESLVWREANDSAAPSAQNCILLITADGGVLTFCESQPMHLWLTTPDGTLSCFKADVNEDIGSAWSLVRLWYDEAEYDALLRDVKPQPKSLSWQEAAQHWADAYYGAHTKAASGSSFKYTWVKALITPAEDTTKAKREQGEIDENTYCFTVEVHFTPESETALHYTMAGNTAECTDPSAPKGAYAFWRCCTIQLGSDGLWHGVMLGTGW